MSSFGSPLAVGVQEILALIFVLVSIIGWIIKQVQGNNQQLPPPVQRPGRRREDRSAEEIDAFLEQVNRNPEQKRQTPAARPAGGNRQRQAGSSSQPPATAMGAGYANQGSKGTSNRQRQQARVTPQQPPQPPPQRPTQNSGVTGSGVAQHVREHMSEHVAQEAQRDVGQGIKDSVAHSMGTGLVAAPSAGNNVRQTATQLFATKKSTSEECCGTARAESLRQMLCSPQNIRQAIVIQEILTRPKCLRQPREDL